MQLYNQHKDELQKYNISLDTLPQIMISMAAMSVFPFAARGVLESILGNLGLNFNEFMEERKTFAADFVFNALKKQQKPYL
jgi:hypothetical protein